MSLLVGFSANDTIYDKGIRLAESRLEGDTAPQPLATHAWVSRRFWQANVMRYQGIEAVTQGVRLFDPASKRGQRVRTYLLHVEAEAEATAWAYALGKVGDPYSWGACALACVYLLTGQQTRFLGSAHARFECAELVTDALRAGGIAVLGDRPDVNVTPAALERYVATIGSAVPS